MLECVLRAMYKLAGKFAMFYSVATLIFYASVYFFWPEIRLNEPATLFYKLENYRIWWQILWWGNIFVSLTLLPLFYVLFRIFAPKNELLAAMTLFLALIAVIFGLLGPLQQATVISNISYLYTNTNDYMARTNLVNQYLITKAYGEGLFCLFGSTCLIGWVGLSGIAILFYGFFAAWLGKLGLLVSALWILSLFFRIFGGASPHTYNIGVGIVLSFLTLLAFLAWVFFMGLTLMNKKVKGV